MRGPSTLEDGGQNRTDVTQPVQGMCLTIRPHRLYYEPASAGFFFMAKLKKLSGVQHKKTAVSTPFLRSKKTVSNQKVSSNPRHREDFERLLDDAVAMTKRPKCADVQ